MHDRDEWEERCQMFVDPGGKSALRAAGKRNPRNRPCPTCGAKNRLTLADVARHYQCDSCANAAERGYDY
jgi:predicted  nucleic acid-binding Zn ribbon protein